MEMNWREMENDRWRAAFEASVLNARMIDVGLVDRSTARTPGKAQHTRTTRNDLVDDLIDSSSDGTVTRNQVSLCRELSTAAHPVPIPQAYGLPGSVRAFHRAYSRSNESPHAPYHA